MNHSPEIPGQKTGVFRMKIVTIAGTVGRDSVLRSLQDGTKVLGFSVAVDDGYGQNKSTLWFDVSLFGKRAESLSQHIVKGTRITVSGEISTRVHDGSTYLTIRASDVALQGGGNRGNDGGSSSNSRRGQDRDSYGNNHSDLDSDEIPF